MKKLFEYRLETIDLSQTDCASLLERLNAVSETFDNEAISFCTDGDELDIYVKQLESDEVYEARMRREVQAASEILACKRKQFEKLKVELNEN